MAYSKKLFSSVPITKYLFIIVTLGLILYFIFDVSFTIQQKLWSYDGGQSRIQEDCEVANNKAARIDKEKDPKCEGRYIYVYDLPREFNEDLVDKCGRGADAWVPMCGNLENHGYGPLLKNDNNNGTMEDGRSSSEGTWLEPAHSWFQTEQFSLEFIFHERIIGSYPCLTHDPTIAQLFYIPFFAGLDAAFTLFTPHLHLRDLLTQRLIGWLSNSPVWSQFKDTKRHFIVLGRITWDFSRREELGPGGWGTSLMSQKELYHVTKLLIERNHLGNGEIGIPYPTSFHPSSVQDVELWQRKLKASERKILCTFIGAKWTGTPSSKSLRKEIGKQCERVGNSTCFHATCGNHTNIPNTIDCVKHPERVTSLFLRTTFCIQPTGDSPTRKSLFDSLIAGCIPVFFSALSAYEQYIWHLPRNGSSYSVFLDANDVISGNVDIIATLTRIASDIPRLRQMQQQVVSMLPHLVYAAPHENITHDTFHDAIDVAIHSLLQSAPLK